MKLSAHAPWLPCCASCAEKAGLQRVAEALRAPMPVFEPGPPWMRSARIGRPMSVQAGAATQCPGDPPAPAGFRVWTGPVPIELTQWAIDLLHHVNQYAYGTTWTMTYQGTDVLARKDHHTWTWRGGVLVTGICIPGITLYTSAPAAPGAASADEGSSAKFSEEGAPEGLSWWQLLLIGVAAGVAADEVLRAFGRRRHAA